MKQLQVTTLAKSFQRLHWCIYWSFFLFFVLCTLFCIYISIKYEDKRKLFTVCKSCDILSFLGLIKGAPGTSNTNQNIESGGEESGKPLHNSPDNVHTVDVKNAPCIDAEKLLDTKNDDHVSYKWYILHLYFF